MALQYQSAPGTLKSSVLLALAQSLVLQAPCQSHVPLAQQIVHCTVSHLSCCQHGQFHLLSLGGLTSWAGIQSSLHCQGCLTSWSTSRGTGSGLLATSSVP